MVSSAGDHDPSFSLAKCKAVYAKMLPSIRRHARIAFRYLKPEAKQEAVQNVLCNTWAALVGLARRGALDLAYPSVLARFGIKQTRDHRITGGHLDVKDVLSEYGRNRSYFAEPLPVVTFGGEEVPFTAGFPRTGLARARFPARASSRHEPGHGFQRRPLVQVPRPLDRLDADDQVPEPVVLRLRRRFVHYRDTVPHVYTIAVEPLELGFLRCVLCDRHTQRPPVPSLFRGRLLDGPDADLAARPARIARTGRPQ